MSWDCYWHHDWIIIFIVCCDPNKDGYHSTTAACCAWVTVYVLSSWYLIFPLHQISTPSPPPLPITYLALHSSSSSSLLFPGIRWRGEQILLRIPVRDRPEVQLKCLAFDVLLKRRKDWGFQRKWEGNYLIRSVSRYLESPKNGWCHVIHFSQDENSRVAAFETSLNHLKRAHEFERVVFSCEVMKVSTVVCHYHHFRQTSYHSCSKCWHRICLRFLSHAYL